MAIERELTKHVIKMAKREARRRRHWVLGSISAGRSKVFEGTIGSRRSVVPYQRTGTMINTGDQSGCNEPNELSTWFVQIDWSQPSSTIPQWFAAAFQRRSLSALSFSGWLAFCGWSDLRWSRTTGYELGKLPFPTATSQPTAVMLGREKIFYIFQLSIGYVLGTEEFVSFASPTNRYLTVFRWFIELVRAEIQEIRNALEGLMKS